MKISILIITYGRYKELLETLSTINSYKPSLEHDNIEVLLLDNNLNDKLRIEVCSIFKNNECISFSYYNDGINYGVAQGRNYLINKSKGDVLITLDDDVDLESISNLINTIKNYFNRYENLGVLAFNIKNFYTKSSLRHEIPHGRKNIDLTKNFQTYYFIGAGHAIRKSVYENVGLYPRDLGLYGGEERDLSFRVLEKGYDILYANDVIIYHKVSPDGRLSRKQEDFFRYRNQLIVLNRYMPFLYRFSSNIAWSLFYLFRKNGKLSDVFSVLKECFLLEKKTISVETIDKMKKCKARMFY